MVKEVFVKVEIWLKIATPKSSKSAVRVTAPEVAVTVQPDVSCGVLPVVGLTARTVKRLNNCLTLLLLLLLTTLRLGDVALVLRTTRVTRLSLIGFLEISFIGNHHFLVG
jgi:hypothetical protein